jgi:hypothetical protein
LRFGLVCAVRVSDYSEDGQTRVSAGFVNPAETRFQQLAIVHFAILVGRLQRAPRRALSFEFCSFHCDNGLTRLPCAGMGLA